MVHEHADQPADHRAGPTHPAGHQADHTADHRADHSAEHRADHTADHRADHTANHRADHTANHTGAQRPDRRAHDRSDVELRIPADSAYLAVLRTATAGLAARLDFTLDDIEDLRIAVDEACAMVLPQARENSDLTCTFNLEAARLTVAVTAECDTPLRPDRNGFAWTVLAALTTEVSAHVEGDRLTVTLARGTSDAG